MRTILSLITSTLAICTVAAIGNTQTKFETPARVPSYESYIYLEDCVSAAERILYTYNKTKEIVDTFSLERKKRYSKPLPKAVKDTGAVCSSRWSLDSVEAKYITNWSSDLMKLGRTLDVKNLYKRYIDSIPAAERLDARGQIMNLYQEYLDDDLLADYLVYWTEYHNEIPPDSLPLKLSSLLSKIVTWVQLWEPTRAESELDAVIVYLASLSEERRRSPIISFIADRFFPTAKMVKEPEILEKLTESTTAYTRYINDLWMKIGNMNPLISPLDSVAPDLIGRWMFAAQADSRGKFKAVKVSGNSLVRPVKGKVNLVTFIEAGCHNSSFISTGQNSFERLNAEVEGERNPGNICARTAAAINRIKTVYPDLEVTIVTKTFGSVGNILYTSPEIEAEVMAKYFIENFGMNAHVVVSDTEHFRLPGLDNRRIDISTENEENYQIANQRNSAHTNVILVDQEGKIFFSGLLIGDDENVARNFAGAVLKRGHSASVRP